MKASANQEQVPLKKVLILGSGGLRIGQAGEFDYSGSQAIKALKEEGVEVILVNPNIATVQTDRGMADKVYLQPLRYTTLRKIIEKERPQGILLGFGGQTALNLGLELEERGALEEFGVRVLGTPVNSIRVSEDRDLFKKALMQIDVSVATSRAVSTVEDALSAAKAIGYPLMMRSAFSLGGQGAGIVRNEAHLKARVREALSGAPQILIEECLAGWKEVEYEIVRDAANNTITVCNMENFDPMGIHTGESIVVAPSQTLSNEDYHMLREVAIKVARHLGIIGECNIQYALDPDTGAYRVIEVNPRLSRSSALASKATGYPLAFVAAKLSLGYRLDELRNVVTGETCAFFEPALDYLVVKMPRWDIHKFRTKDRSIGSEMKSVGEVMAIGRSFPEALQKAIRMLNCGHSGFCQGTSLEGPLAEIEQATDRRIFALYQALKEGVSVESLHTLSKIDLWFLHHLRNMVELEDEIEAADELDPELLRRAKKSGFSDLSIARLKNVKEDEIRKLRLKSGILPYVKQIDTLAGEFAAKTNYLYCTYHGDRDDIQASSTPSTIVLGSGPYCIGSSVEFDWCAVNTVRTLRELGERTVMINSNPETVSTDFDESDRLYFEELTLERVRDIADFETNKGIIVSVGGQIANNLAVPLDHRGYEILGTPAACIDQAEDRNKFSSLLNHLNIDQPRWVAVSTLEKARSFAREVGYPLLVRPSYVLSGAAMNVIHSDEELKSYLEEAAVLSKEHPAVLSQFILNAKELEIDGVAQNGEVVIQAISEHIENAGIHSGDATIVLPPQRLYLETIRRTKKITKSIIKNLNISGPFNIQFLAKDNEIKVIECNVRASRSFPFVSKVVGHNLIQISTQVLLNRYKPQSYETLELDWVGVKTPQFSYKRLKGANPVARVEMASTGEVACLADNFLESFFSSWHAADQALRGKRILVSIGGEQKWRLLPALKKLEDAGWDIFATRGTHHFLSRHGVGNTFLYKVSEKMEPNIRSCLADQEVDIILNLPRGRESHAETDGFRIRRLAIDHNIPLVTNLQIAQLFLQCLSDVDPDNIPVKSWQEFTGAKVLAQI